MGYRLYCVDGGSAFTEGNNVFLTQSWAGKKHAVCDSHRVSCDSYSKISEFVLNCILRVTGGSCLATIA
jgi:hypothetical protein